MLNFCFIFFVFNKFVTILMLVFQYILCKYKLIIFLQACLKIETFRRVIMNIELLVCFFSALMRGMALFLFIFFFIPASCRNMAPRPDLWGLLSWMQR